MSRTGWGSAGAPRPLRTVCKHRTSPPRGSGFFPHSALRFPHLSPPVLQLAHVVIAAEAVGALGALPTEEDVAAGLHQALAGDHAGPVVAVRALLGKALQDWRLRLLGLQEQHICIACPVQEEDPGPG